MKKLLTLLLCLGLVATAYAFTVNNATVGGLSVKPYEEVVNVLVNDGTSQNYVQTVTLNKSQTLKGCTSQNGSTFYEKSGTNYTFLADTTDYVMDAFVNIKADKDVTGFKVAQIKLSNDDELNKALRISLINNGEVYIYAPFSESYQSWSGSTLKDVALNPDATLTKSGCSIKVWYDSQSSYYTEENIDKAKGTNIEILFTAF